MVVVDELLAAQTAEVADPTVVAGPRIRLVLDDRALRGTARARDGSTPRTRRCGTSRARRARSRRGCARRARPGSARAARRRSRAGGRAPASPTARASCRPARTCPSGCRSRKSAKPRQRASREVRLVDDVRLADADRLLGEPPGLVRRRTPRRRRSGCGRPSAPRPRAARGRPPRAPRPSGRSGRDAASPDTGAPALRARHGPRASSGAGRRGAPTGRRVRARSSRRPRGASIEYRRSGGRVLRHRTQRTSTPTSTSSHARSAVNTGPPTVRASARHARSPSESPAFRVDA